MSQSVDDARIAKFHQDRSLLLYNDIYIAKRMAMDKSNYSSYINNRKPITIKFLHKFYSEFGEELKTIKKQQISEADNGRGLESEHVSLDKLHIEYKLLSKKYTLLIQSQQIVSENLLRLEAKADHILDEFVKLRSMLSSVLNELKKSL